MATSLPPGYRFHPTDVELTVYYLKRKLLGRPLRCNAVTDIDLYKFAPWELPEKASLQTGDREWYFFCMRDRKYSSGSRTNRSTEAGYWKATGKDRAVIHKNQTVGMKRTLVFHSGKPPQGTRTDWVMYEYRLVDKDISSSDVKLDNCVLCKIFKKSGAGPKIGEQYGAPFNEEEWNDLNGAPSVPHSAPGSSNGVLNSAGQQLPVSDDGEVSLSPLSENNVERAANCTRADASFDSINIQQLADIIGRFSTKFSVTAGQAGALPDLTAKYDNETSYELQPDLTADHNKLSFDDETIFDELDKVPSGSVESISKQCASCGGYFIEPMLEPVEGEQYFELNDLLSSLADGHPGPSCLVASNDASHECHLDLELNGISKSSTTSAVAAGPLPC